MDFIDGLPSSQGHTVIMVIVDRLSKYSHFVPLKHPYTAITVAKAFADNVVRLHGIPTSIISDRDKVFVSTFWKTLFNLQGTTLNMSSSYHPQTDGQTEVVNRTLEQYLRCFTSDQPKRWMEWLSWAEYSYNTSVHSVTQISPFEAVYRVPPPSILSYIPGTSKVQAVDELLRSRTDILQDLRHHLSIARNQMKVQADQHRREVNFDIEDYVYLKLQPYRQKSIVFRSSLKLSPRFFGPFRVLARVQRQTENKKKRKLKGKEKLLPPPMLGSESESEQNLYIRDVCITHQHPVCLISPGCQMSIQVARSEKHT